MQHFKFENWRFRFLMSRTDYMWIKILSQRNLNTLFNISHRFLGGIMEARQPNHYRVLRKIAYDSPHNLFSVFFVHFRFLSIFWIRREFFREIAMFSSKLSHLTFFSRRHHGGQTTQSSSSKDSIAGDLSQGQILVHPDYSEGEIPACPKHNIDKQMRRHSFSPDSDTNEWSYALSFFAHISFK